MAEQLPEYELLRRKAQQRAQVDEQNRTDALKRRFAAQGGLSSGSYIKQQQLAIDESARAKEEALQGVDIAEAQERTRRDENAFQRALQERQVGLQEKGLASQQEQFGKSFGLQEQAQRAQQGQFDQAQQTQREQFGQQHSFQKEQADFANTLSRQQFDFSKDTTGRQLTLQEQQQKRDELTQGFNFLVSLAGAPNEQSLLDYLNLSERLGRPPTIQEIQGISGQRNQDFAENFINPGQQPGASAPQLTGLSEVQQRAEPQVRAMIQEQAKFLQSASPEQKRNFASMIRSRNGEAHYQVAKMMLGV